MKLTIQFEGLVLAKSKYTKELVKETERLAGLLYTDKEIYDALGINYDTFYDYKKKYSEFSEALSRGRKKTRERIIAAAIAKSETDTYMQTFMLRNKFGYMEAQQRKSLDIKRKELKIKEEQFKLQKERFIADVAEKAQLNSSEILELLKKHGLQD